MYTKVDRQFPTVSDNMKQTSMALINAAVLHPDMDSWFYAYHQLPKLDTSAKSAQIIPIGQRGGQ